MSSAAYPQLCERSREVYLLRSVAGVLSWDFETYIPSKAVPYRAEQLSYLEAKAHTLFTELAVGDWLKAAEQVGFEPDRRKAQISANGGDPTIARPKFRLRWSKNLRRRGRIAREAWVQARAESKFSLFEPHLEKIVELTRQKADLWGYEESPYDALDR